MPLLDGAQGGGMRFLQLMPQPPFVGHQLLLLVLVLQLQHLVLVLLH